MPAMRLLDFPDDPLRCILAAAGPADAAALAWGNRRLWALRREVHGCAHAHALCFCVSGLLPRTDRAAAHGHIRCMAQALSSYGWHRHTTARAAEHGRTEAMVAAVVYPGNPCPWSEGTTLVAAANGHTETMLAAVRLTGNPCPWTLNTTGIAAQNGHTGAMLAAVRAGCAWHPWTTTFAALNGHTGTMLAAVCLPGNPCPWGSKTLWAAIRYGHLETARAAQAAGCPE